MGKTASGFVMLGALLGLAVGCASPLSPLPHAPAFVELHEAYSMAMVSYFKDDASAKSNLAAFLKKYSSIFDRVKWRQGEAKQLREGYCLASARLHVLSGASDKQIHNTFTSMAPVFRELAYTQPPQDMQQLKAFVRLRDDHEWEGWLYPGLVTYAPAHQPTQPKLKWYGKDSE